MKLNMKRKSLIRAEQELKLLRLLNEQTAKEKAINEQIKKEKKENEEKEEDYYNKSFFQKNDILPNKSD